MRLLVFFIPILQFARDAEALPVMAEVAQRLERGAGEVHDQRLAPPVFDLIIKRPPPPPGLGLVMALSAFAGIMIGSGLTMMALPSLLQYGEIIRKSKCCPPTRTRTFVDATQGSAAPEPSTERKLDERANPPRFIVFANTKFPNVICHGRQETEAGTPEHPDGNAAPEMPSIPLGWSITTFNDHMNNKWLSAVKDGVKVTFKQAEGMVNGRKVKRSDVSKELTLRRQEMIALHNTTYYKKLFDDLCSKTAETTRTLSLPQEHDKTWNVVSQELAKMDSLEHEANLNGCKTWGQFTKTNSISFESVLQNVESMRSGRPTVREADTIDDNSRDKLDVLEDAVAEYRTACENFDSFVSGLAQQTIDELRNFEAWVGHDMAGSDLLITQMKILATKPGVPIEGADLVQMAADLTELYEKKNLAASKLGMLATVSNEFLRKRTELISQIGSAFMPPIRYTPGLPAVKSAEELLNSQALAVDRQAEVALSFDNLRRAVNREEADQDEEETSKELGNFFYNSARREFFLARTIANKNNRFGYRKDLVPQEIRSIINRDLGFKAEQHILLSFLIMNFWNRFMDEEFIRNIRGDLAQGALTRIYSLLGVLHMCNQLKANEILCEAEDFTIILDKGVRESVNRLDGMEGNERFSSVAKYVYVAQAVLSKVSGVPIGLSDGKTVVKGEMPEMKRAEEEWEKYNAEVESQQLAEVESQQHGEVELKQLAEVESKQLAEVESKQLAEVESKQLAEVELKQLAEVESKQLAEVESQQHGNAEERIIAVNLGGEPIFVAVPIASADEMEDLYRGSGSTAEIQDDDQMSEDFVIVETMPSGGTREYGYVLPRKDQKHSTRLRIAPQHAGAHTAVHAHEAHSTAPSSMRGIEIDASAANQAMDHQSNDQDAFHRTAVHPGVVKSETGETNPPNKADDGHLHPASAHQTVAHHENDPITSHRSIDGDQVVPTIAHPSVVHSEVGVGTLHAAAAHTDVQNHPHTAVAIAEAQHGSPAATAAHHASSTGPMDAAVA